MTAPRAVVTGGAGFIGSNLVDRLVDEGIDVLVIDDLSSGSLANLIDARQRGNVTMHQIDVTDDGVQSLIRDYRPATVYHLAAQIDVRRSMSDPVFDARVNVVGTLNVLEAARNAAAERFVFASSGGATSVTPSTSPRPRPSPGRRPRSTASRST